MTTEYILYNQSGNMVCIRDSMADVQKDMADFISKDLTAAQALTSVYSSARSATSDDKLYAAVIGTLVSSKTNKTIKPGIMLKNTEEKITSSYYIKTFENPA